MDIITRKDKYYSAIANGTADVPQPITRQEQYLYAMATKSGVVPEPVTPNEPYLYAICKGTKDIPAPVTRVQKYLYAIATGDDKVGQDSPYDWWLRTAESTTNQKNFLSISVSTGYLLGESKSNSKGVALGFCT